ncbi:MAG: hypothetical protein LBR30_00455 [Clostridioides sp.]|nr:hypothetical protein [Clostridioides sp.]
MRKFIQDLDNPVEYDLPHYTNYFEGWSKEEVLELRKKIQKELDEEDEELAKIEEERRRKEEEQNKN